MLESFDNVSFLWDGSWRLGGYEGGETEDYYAWCDPEGRHDFPDCNRNTVPNRIDILFGRLHGENRNGVPDECERKDGSVSLPVVSSESFLNDTLTILGRNFGPSTSVDVNGQLVRAPPYTMAARSRCGSREAPASLTSRPLP